VAFVTYADREHETDRAIERARIARIEASARFWQRVKIEGGKKCWLWQGSKDGGGYGWFSFMGKNCRASRFALETAIGPLRRDELACHSCDEPSCVRPTHLFAGTNAENCKDKAQKGRAPRGAKVPTARLSEDKIQRIRKAAEKKTPIARIARRYHVSATQIRNITSGKHWGHVAPRKARGARCRLDVSTLAMPTNEAGAKEIEPTAPAAAEETEER